MKTPNSKVAENRLTYSAGLPSNVTDWEEQVVAMGYSLEPPEIDHEFLNFTLSKEGEEHVAPAKRQNCYNKAIVTETTQNVEIL